MSTDDLDRDAIRARAEDATPGPWTYRMDPFYEGVSYEVFHEFDFYGPHAEEVAVGMIEEDAEFIAHARTDIPALVAMVRERDAEIVRLVRDLGDTDVMLQNAHVARMAADAGTLRALTLADKDVAHIATLRDGRAQVADVDLSLLPTHRPRSAWPARARALGRRGPGRRRGGSRAASGTGAGSDRQTPWKR